MISQIEERIFQMAYLLQLPDIWKSEVILYLHLEIWRDGLPSLACNVWEIVINEIQHFYYLAVGIQEKLFRAGVVEQDEQHENQGHL